MFRIDSAIRMIKHLIKGLIHYIIQNKKNLTYVSIYDLTNHEFGEFDQNDSAIS